MPRPELIIVGAGMYVCGRGTEGFGTVLPAAFEAYRAGLCGRLTVAGNSAAGVGEARERAARLARLMGVSPEIRFLPGSGDDPESWKAALAETSRPAAAVVSVPDHLHHRVAMAMIEAGVHTLVVKPLAPSAAEAAELAAAARARGVLGMVEYHKRFDEANLKLRELIGSGALGEIKNFRIQFSQRLTIPLEVFRNWVAHTDIFQYLGVHYVDLVAFLTAAAPERVCAVETRGFLSSRGVDTSDTIQALIRWRGPNGGSFVSDHLSGWIDPARSSAMSDQRLEVVGSRGRYLSDQKDRGITFSSEAGDEKINPYFSQLLPDADGRLRAVGYGPRSILTFIEDAGRSREEIARIIERPGLRADFASSVMVAGVCEAVRESIAAGGSWVTVAGEGGI